VCSQAELSIANQPLFQGVVVKKDFNFIAGTYTAAFVDDPVEPAPEEARQ
jgi:hypothetical protein